MIITILSHIVASLYMQKPKYNKRTTFGAWSLYAFFSVCIMLFQDNIIYGFFGMFFMQALIFFVTTIGEVGEKLFLFLTYANSFCICIGANMIVTTLFGESAYLQVCLAGIVVLMHVFLYKILLPIYKKAQKYFSSGWWKLNIVLVFFLIQFLNQYAFKVVDKSSAVDLLFDFVVFSVIFYLTLILIFDLVKDVAEMNKKTYENQELKNIAYIDVLTNMQNRAAYLKYTKRKVSYHKKNNDANYILGVLDIDGFKRINDTKGHAAGDEILKQVGAFITKYFDTYKCESFRVGGDEFVLVLEDMQLFEVEKTLENMNEELFKSCKVKMSFGCSEVDFNHSKPFDVAFKTADSIMYTNKKQIK